MKIAILSENNNLTHDIKDLINNYSQKSEQPFFLYEYKNVIDLFSLKIEYDVFIIDYKSSNSDIYYENILRSIRKTDVNTQIVFCIYYKDRDIIFKYLKFNIFHVFIKPIVRKEFEETFDFLVFEKNSLAKIVLKDSQRKKYITILKSEIMYGQAENVYVSITTTKGNYIYMNNMKSIEKELNSSLFYRTNRSFIVNLNYIKNLR